jgi:hypothetical protein
MVEAEIVERMDAIIESIRKRMLVADRAMLGLRPAEMDWATSDELRELERLRLELPRSGQVQAEARERVAAKRAARVAAMVAHGTAHERPWDEGAELYREAVRVDCVVNADGTLREIGRSS